MGKLQDFLMTNQEPAQVTTEVEIGQFPVPFTIKSITEGENKARSEERRVGKEC